jgi:hypothetical protein
LEKYPVDIDRFSKTTRMVLDPNYIELYPVGEGETRLRIISKADPKLSWVPDFMVNWILKKALNMALGFLVDKARVIDKPGNGNKWIERVEGNKEFYDWVRKVGDNARVSS